MNEQQQESKISKVISVRLNRAIDGEREALNIYEALLQDYAPREIITHALLQMGGITPEMFRERGRRASILDLVLDKLEDQSSNAGMLLAQIKDELEAMRFEQAEQMRDLLNKIKAVDPAAFKAFADEPPDHQDDATNDEAFIKNAIAAMRPGFRRSK